VRGALPSATTPAAAARAVAPPRPFCLSAAAWRRGHATLVPLREEHMESVRRWRNAQLAVLRQAGPLSPEDQRRYWREGVAPTWRQRQPEQLLFALLREGRPVAYGGLVHIAWRDGRAEVSFLADPLRAADPEAYAADQADALALLCEVAFDELGLRRLTTETFDLRPRHVAGLERAGFRPEGRLRAQVVVDGRPVDSLLHGLLREEWADAR